MIYGYEYSLLSWSTETTTNSYYSTNVQQNIECIVIVYHRLMKMNMVFMDENEYDVYGIYLHVALV